LPLRTHKGLCRPLPYKSHGHGPQLALDFPLGKQGGVCAIANASCCTYINTSGIVEECADYIHQQAKWLRKKSLETQISTQVWDQIKSWLLSRTCFLPFLGPILAIILLLVFGPCILNLLVNFVSSHLESINLQMPLMELKMTYYLGPLDNPLSWSVLTLWAPSSPPVSRKQSLNRLCHPYF
jgi:hypothetical protein